MLKVEKLGVWIEDEEVAKKTIEVVNAIELGRIVTRDIGGSDPERMAAPKVVEYVKTALESTEIKVAKI